MEKQTFSWGSMNMHMLVLPDPHPLRYRTTPPLLSGPVVCVGLASPPALRSEHTA